VAGNTLWQWVVSAEDTDASASTGDAKDKDILCTSCSILPCAMTVAVQLLAVGICIDVCACSSLLIICL
jgi:hypothetical protein